MTLTFFRHRTALLLFAVTLLLLAMLGAAATIAARYPVALLNRLTPGFARAVDSDIAYGILDRQILDVYQPAAPRTKPAPVVVFFYGGAWRGGDRRDYRFLGQALARAGYTVVIPDYRLSPTVSFPTFLEDGAKAIRWTQDHIAGHGGDPHRLFLMGHSAGAYNAMMLALDRRYGEAAGVDRENIRGVVGLAGPYKFALDTPALQSVFGSTPDPHGTQPINFALPDSPPVLLVTGDADDTVNPENSRKLAQALTAAGNRATILEVADLDHMAVLLQLSPLWSPGSALRSEILRFLDKPD